MAEPPPVATVHLFPDLLEELLGLLTALPAGEWERSVPRKHWRVRDVALHLLGGDTGVLSRLRDGHTASLIVARSRAELVRGLAALNDAWIAAARGISPRLLCDLLRFTGTQVAGYFETLDPTAAGEVVSWAGPEPAPNWLDIGREYTERWHHQEHIRAALGRPGLDAPRYLAPALAIFVRALPQTYRGVDAAEGTAVAVTISGESGGRWLVIRRAGAWRLEAGPREAADASVRIPEDVAWKLFTRWLPPDEAAGAVQLAGDETLARRVLDTTAVIA